MNRLAKIGLIPIAAFGISNCTAESTEPAEVKVTVMQEATLREDANDLRSYKATLRLGSEVTAICYFESAALAMDSVRLAPGDGLPGGYVFVGTRTDEGAVISNFDIDPSRLQASLPNCADLTRYMKAFETQSPVDLV